MKSCDTVVGWVALRIMNLNKFSSSFVFHQSSLGPHILCTSASANSQFKHANGSYNLKDEQDIMVMFPSFVSQLVPKVPMSLDHTYSIQGTLERTFV